MISFHRIVEIIQQEGTVKNACLAMKEILKRECHVDTEKVIVSVIQEVHDQMIATMVYVVVK